MNNIIPFCMNVAEPLHLSFPLDCKKFIVAQIFLKSLKYYIYCYFQSYMKHAHKKTSLLQDIYVSKNINYFQSTLC